MCAVLVWLAEGAGAGGATVARVFGDDDRGHPLGLFDRAWAQLPGTPAGSPPVLPPPPPPPTGPPAPPPPASFGAPPIARPPSSPATTTAPPEPVPIRLWRYLQGWRTPPEQGWRVLLVDDAERAGTDSRDGLAALERLMPLPSMLLVVATSRPLLEGPAPEEGAVAPPSEGEVAPVDGPTSPPGPFEGPLGPLTVVVEVPPLPRGDRLDLAARSLRGTFCVGSSEQTLALFLERTDGVPLTVLELTAYLDAEGWVARTPDGLLVRPPGATEGRPPAGKEPFPVDRRYFQARRLARLSATERELLRAPARCPPRPDTPEIAAAAGSPPEEVAEVLDLLDASGVLLRDGTGPDPVWSFPHETLREAALERGTDAASAASEAYLRLASWWSQAHPADLLAIAELRHLAGGDGEDASGYVPAAEEALGARSWSCAEEVLGWMAEATVRQGGPDPRTFAELLRLLRRLRTEGEGDVGERPLRVLVDAGLAVPCRWEAAAELAAAELSRDPAAGAARYDHVCQEMASDPRSATASTRLLLDTVLLEVLLLGRRFDEGIALADDLLHRLGPHGDLRVRLDVLDRKAWSLMGNTHRWREAHAVFLMGAALAQRAGLVDREASHVSGQAFVRAQEGRSEEAVELFQQAAHLAEVAGDLPGLCLERGNLAEVLALLRRYPEAEEVLASGLEMARSLDLRASLLTLLRVRGELDAAQRRWPEATRRFEECLLIAGESEGSPGTPLSMLRLLQLRAQGESGDAEAALEEREGYRTRGRESNEEEEEGKEEAEVAVARWRTQARLEELCGRGAAAVLSRRESEKILLQRREELRPGDRRMLELLSPPAPPPPPPGPRAGPGAG